MTDVTKSSFDGLLDEYLKPEHIDTFPAEAFVTFCTIELRDGKPKVVYDLQYNRKKYKWSCNKTNLKIIRKLGLKSPNDLCESSVVFDKIKVRNPSTGERMDSLEVIKVK